MIDHTGVVVSDIEASIKFYVKALAGIGYRLLTQIPPEVTQGPSVAGLGDTEKPDFWLIEGAPNTPPVHIAFRAQQRSLVDRFHRDALAAGGRDNGAPGVRAHYHPHYYGAFVKDLDGHNIEVVCHGQES